MAFRPIRDTPLGKALSWSDAGRLDGRAVAIAVLGMTVPVLAGLAMGRPDIGFTIGLGAMLLTDAPNASDAGAKEGPSPGSAIPPAALAVILATLICAAPSPWADIAMVLLAGGAAAISGYSRPVAVAAIRFIIYLVLSYGLLQSAGAHRGGAALIFGLGALWNIALRMLLAGPRADSVEAAPPERKPPTPAQLRAHWRRTMSQLAGWQFPIRVILGLAAASVLRHLWPSHHYGWIVLTVALLTQRPIEHLPVKAIQRALGTSLGVALTWAILIGAPSQIVLAVVICVLATAATLLRPRSYLAYAVVSSPVILLVMDLGKPIETALLTDRLAATAMGAAIVVAANLILDLMLRTATTTASKKGV